MDDGGSVGMSILLQIPPMCRMDSRLRGTCGSLEGYVVRWKGMLFDRGASYSREWDMVRRRGMLFAGMICTVSGARAFNGGNKCW